MSQTGLRTQRWPAKFPALVADFESAALVRWERPAGFAERRDPLGEPEDHCTGVSVDSGRGTERPHYNQSKLFARALARRQRGFPRWQADNAE